MKKILLLTIFLFLFLTLINSYKDNSLSVMEDDYDDIKYVAFTFDDGPTEYTDELLDELKERKANVTFFLLGCQCEKYPQTLKRFVDEGHEIGNHGYDHQILSKLKQDEIEFQINNTNAIIKNITGVEPKLLRPAYGIYNDKMLEYIKMPIILWSIDTKDWKVRNSKTIYQRNIDKIKDGDIILFHDKFRSSIKAALMLIDELKEDGYEFLTVSELAQIKGINLNEHKEHFNFSNPTLKTYHECP